MSSGKGRWEGIWWEIRINTSRIMPGTRVPRALHAGLQSSSCWSSLRSSRFWHPFWLPRFRGARRERGGRSANERQLGLEYSLSVEDSEGKLNPRGGQEAVDTAADVLWNTIGEVSNRAWLCRTDDWMRVSEGRGRSWHPVRGG